MTTVKLQLETLSCPSCIKKIEGVLGKQEGVSEAKVLFHSSKVKVAYDETRITGDQIEDTLTRLGYPLVDKVIQK